MIFKNCKDVKGLPDSVVDWSKRQCKIVRVEQHITELTMYQPTAACKAYVGFELKTASGGVIKENTAGFVP